MPGIRRRFFAAIFALVAAASFDFEDLLHAHSDGQADLRAHELSTVESTGTCDRAPHWDSARFSRHGPCAACLVSSIPLGRCAGGAALPASAARPLPAPGAEIPGRSGTARCTRFGRAPPTPVLPAA